MFMKFTIIFKNLFFLSILIPFIFSLKSDTIELDFYEKNNFFTVPIYLGSKEAKFEVQIDTTTSLTWVPSINTTYKVNKFNPKNSETCKISNLTFEIDDEDGNVKGLSLYDAITVGPYTLDKFGFVLIDSFQQNFKDYNQGKLGLGFKHEHGINFNWIALLKQNGLIEKEIFSIIPNEKKLIIGDIPEEYKDEVYTKCNLVETNDLDDVYRAGWVCEMTHIYFGIDTKNKTLEMALQVDARVIFDSAYKYISIPKRHLDDFNKKFLEQYYEDSCIQIKENNEIYYVCDADEKIPTGAIAFVIGGYGYVIPWNKLFKKIFDDKYEMLIRFHKENDDIFIFGYPFVSQFTVVYNAEDKELGFYGGEKINVTKDWDEYMIGESPKQKKEKMKKLLIYLAIFGGFLLFIIICLIIRSNKKANLEKRAMLQNEIENQ